jgi:hypothetical protein
MEMEIGKAQTKSVKSALIHVIRRAFVFDFASSQQLEASS